MWNWNTPLIADGDGAELFYIIAVLVLGIVGAIVDKVKKMGGDEQRGKSPPVPRRPVIREGRPESMSRPRPPRPRPVAREGPQARPTGPATPRPPVRRPAPPARRPEVHVPHPAQPVARRPEAPPAHRPAPRRPVSVRPEKEPTRRLTEPTEPLPAGKPRAPERIGSVQRRPVPSAVAVKPLRELSMAELRQAIILKEILGEPLALRTEGTQSWDR